MERQTKNILIASAAGLAVGALAGILFAPAKGTETRAAISGKAQDLKDLAVDNALALKNKISKVDSPMDILSTLKSKVDKSLTNGKSEVRDELISQIQHLEEAIKKA